MVADREFIVLLGRRDAPCDAVREYCERLAAALENTGRRVQFCEAAWDRVGWLKTLRALWRAAGAWRGRWVLFQYTALMWSRRGFPGMALLMAGLLKWRGARICAVFHDVLAGQKRRWVDRLRFPFQDVVKRAIYELSARAIVTVPIEPVPWLPRDPVKAEHIPVGANLPSAEPRQPYKILEGRPPQVVVYGVTGGANRAGEVADLAYAARHTAEQFPGLQFVLIGRGTDDAEESLRRSLGRSRAAVRVLGLLPADEIARTLAASDVLLFVRGHLSSRRSSAIAGIACGLPVVAYEGPETGRPVTEAGVVLVPQGDRAALTEALQRVLADESFRRELRERNRTAQKKYFAWEVIANSYLHVLASPHPAATKPQRNRAQTAGSGRHAMDSVADPGAEPIPSCLELEKAWKRHRWRS